MMYADYYEVHEAEWLAEQEYRAEQDALEQMERDWDESEGRLWR